MITKRVTDFEGCRFVQFVFSRTGAEKGRARDADRLRVPSTRPAVPQPRPAPGAGGSPGKSRSFNKIALVASASCRAVTDSPKTRRNQAILAKRQDLTSLTRGSTMKLSMFKITATLLLVAAASFLAHAQGGSSSALTGVVVDQSGGVIPGADVAVKNAPQATSSAPAHQGTPARM